MTVRDLLKVTGCNVIMIHKGAEKKFHGNWSDALLGKEIRFLETRKFSMEGVALVAHLAD